MTQQQQQDFRFVLPADEDDEDNYVDDGEMEDDDAIPIDNGDSATDENDEPRSSDGAVGPQQQPYLPSQVNNMLAMEENAYQASQVQNGGYHAQQFGTQIQNQMTSQQEMSKGRMRPQSAKTVPSMHPNAFGAAMGGMGAYNQQNQQQHQQWAINPTMAPGYSQQVLPSGLIYNPQAMVNERPMQRMMSGGGVKRRPGTAGRKAHLNFGKKLGLYVNPQQASNMPQTNMTAKAASQVSLDVYKMRPRIIQQERERLYDDVMKQKMATNNLAHENTRLKTRVQIVEGELLRKEKAIGDLMTQQETSFGMPLQPKFGGRAQSHLVMNLKRKIRDLNLENARRNEEIEALKRNIRSTRQQEIEVEIKLYIEECARLRQQLEEVIKSKDTFADPQELKIIEEKFQQRDLIIAQMQQQNEQLSQQVIMKGQESLKLAEMVHKLEYRLKKAQASSKNNQKFKRDVKDKDREAHKMRKELIDLKHRNHSLEKQMKDNVKSPSVSRQIAPRLQSANPRSNNNNAQADENRRLTFENRRLEGINGQFQSHLQQFESALKEKDEQLALIDSDKVRFKELSESYMQEVARLEAQLEANDLKPKNKLSQRPKDTVMRDQSNSLSVMSAQRTKNVDPRQLQQSILHLKLLLQRQQLACSSTKSMEILLFGQETQTDQSMSIADLRQLFEGLELSQKRATLLSRYLVETQGQGEFIFNENLTTDLADALQSLQKLVGEYCLFKREGSEFDNDPNYVQEEYMHKLVLENFRDRRETLLEALRCEDYEEQGILDLAQLVEAISTVKEDIEGNVLNYMLYFVMVRSQDFDNMEYKHLISLLDALLENQSRVQSTTRKSRPESSSPEKLKMRNQTKSNMSVPLNADGDDNDNYSEEEIADDPDEGDSQNELGKPQTEIVTDSAIEKELAAQQEQQRQDREDAEDEEQYQDEEFEDSPRQKLGAQDGGAQEKQSQQDDEDYEQDNLGAAGDEDEEDEVNEDEVIDVAERVFIRIAEQIISKEIKTVREVFTDWIIETELEGQVIELLAPEGLVGGIKGLGIDDLTDQEIKYLLRVLTKPELEGAIVLQELLQIMENLGLYDDEEDQARDEQDDMDSQDDDEQQDESSPDRGVSDLDVMGESGEKKKKKREPLDLSKLDEKSVKIMVMLMVNLLQLNQTTQQFFEEVIFEQKVKTKTKQFSMVFIKSDDFFTVLKEKSIRSKDTPHENLREFLQLNEENPQLLLLKNIRRTLELMSQNEAFMAAIQEDVLANEAEAAGEDDEDGERLEDAQDNANDCQSEERERSHDLHTVQEGNETNQMTTGEKGMFLGSQNSAQPLSKEMSGQQRKDAVAEAEDENYDEDFNEQDYEF